MSSRRVARLATHEWACRNFKWYFPNPWAVNCLFWWSAVLGFQPSEGKQPTVWLKFCPDISEDSSEFCIFMSVISGSNPLVRGLYVNSSTIYSFKSWMFGHLGASVILPLGASVILPLIGGNISKDSSSAFCVFCESMQQSLWEDSSE